MPYSVMIWMVDPAASEAADGGGETATGVAPRGSAGVFAPPPFRCLSYGLFADETTLEDVLNRLSELLRNNAPIRVQHDDRTFLVPADRVQYVVAEPVSRPTDRLAGDAT